MAHVARNGASIYWDAIGAGEPLVLIMGLGCSSALWFRLAPRLARRYRVIQLDNRGVGNTCVEAEIHTIDDMARDVAAVLDAAGEESTHVLGFSMGGMIAQEIVLKEPDLVRKLILAGTGPAGGPGISTVAGVANYDLLRATFTGQDPKQYLFFTRTPNGIEAGKVFLKRLQERTENRDKKITIRAYVAQLQALRAWGQKRPADLSVVKQPVLVANGDDDRMVPTSNSYDLAKRLPNSQLIIYPDAGHGGVFQYHEDFVPKALAFLAQ